ncbi:transmembrane protein FAM155B [Protopterus annectens]|uniref:transmembrane protein FAM155B n=1 Tax=Protopterus annectens TaxID=7888 RepID=UPI001CF98F7F|nr:transmembrane protein FAM155B [Protopterus annectens]
MIRGAWMYRREDDAVLKICCAPRQNDKPCADSERAQKWRMSLASLLFFTVLLSDHLWLCAGAKFRSKDRGLGYTNNNATGDGGGEVYLRITSNPNLQLVVGDPHFVEAGRCEDIFISNLTKSAAPVPPCIGAHVHLDLDSACTQLQSLLQGDCTSSLSLNKSSLLAYFKSFSLSFCDSYTISDLLLSGMARGPDSLNCSLENLILDLGRTSVAGDWEVCSSCVQAYQTLDQHAQEKYEEFDSLLEKYLQGEEYSVRSCLGDCKVRGKSTVPDIYAMINTTKLSLPDSSYYTLRTYFSPFATSAH